MLPKNVILNMVLNYSHMKIFVRISMIAVITLIAACKSKPKEEVEAKQQRYIHSNYRGSETKYCDLVSTRLFLEPNFEDREITGRAELQLKPHFYSTDSVVLDAKYMRIVKVALDLSAGKPTASGLRNIIDLKYTYDSIKLKIELDRYYSKDEKINLIIEYVAQPEKVVIEGSAAITSDKGVYFINHKGLDPDKPVQMWTQGETDAASCWFPTIDAPNQKTTQEIHVKVDKKFRTISNGKLVASSSDSFKRTDVWVQDLPHAPYLFALVVGEFSKIEDKLGSMPVDYYVEKEYEPYAKLVFGHTPEMIKFFGEKLGTPYPWDKYSQVVVRDFVSGAMENTGCVIHFDKLQHNDREHLDNTYENVISHELFHHWFGDLVTCESWANLPLNESFATYGEYLWDEFKYGRDQADVALENFRSTYKFSNSYSSVSMIRYDYDKQEDMFDANSYHKGGAVLHMLRKHVGDEAFFLALKNYLNRYKYSTAELSDLRKCFEEVTGEDLNWFFNQWFITKDFPVLKVKMEVEGKDMKLTVVQTSDFFRLSLDVDAIDQNGSKRHRLMIEKDSQTFIIPMAAGKALIFDAENQLLCEKEIQSSEAIWRNQFQYAVLAQHKMEAFSNLLNLLKTPEEKNKLCMEMLNHSFYKCRGEVLVQMFNSENNWVSADLYEKVNKIAISDPKSEVRMKCCDILANQKSKKILVQMLQDSSYDVVEQAFHKLYELDPVEAYQLADSYRNSADDRTMKIVAVIIALSSQGNEVDYFHQIIKNRNSKNINSIAWVLANYFEKSSRSDQIDHFVAGLKEMLDDRTNNRARENAKKTVKTLIFALEQYNDYYSYLIKENPKLKKAFTEMMANQEKLRQKLSELKFED